MRVAHDTLHKLKTATACSIFWWEVDINKKQGRNKCTICLLRLLHMMLSYKNIYYAIPFQGKQYYAKCRQSMRSNWQKKLQSTKKWKVNVMKSGLCQHISLYLSILLNYSCFHIIIRFLFAFNPLPLHLVYFYNLLDIPKFIPYKRSLF